MHLQLQPGDGEIEADGEHGADQRLLQVGGVLRAEDPRARAGSGELARIVDEHSGEPVGTPHGPDRLDADQRIGELGRALPDLMAALLGLLAPAPDQPAEPEPGHDHRGDRDQQELPREQAQDRHEQRDLQATMRSGW